MVCKVFLRIMETYQMQGENKCLKVAKVYNSAGPQVTFVEESFA